jgi:hypothetical protein
MYVFNIMDPQYEYVEVYLDSLDSVQTDPAFLKTDWPTFYLNRAVQNVAKMKVLSAEIPFSYYVINATNNTFFLTESSSALVTLPVGNYTSSTLSSTLGTALTTASLGLGSRTYTVTYNNTTQKLSITSTGAFSLTFGSSNDSGQTNPRFILGFNGGVISSVGNAITAPNAVQITGPNYVYLNSTQLGSITQTFLPLNSINLQSGQKGPQIARIPIQCNPGDVSYYTDPAPEKWFDLENLRQIQNLDLYFTLGNQSVERALRFNGQNFSVKLGLLLYKNATNQVGSQPLFYRRA